MTSRIKVFMLALKLKTMTRQRCAKFPTSSLGITLLVQKPSLMSGKANYVFF